VLTEVHQQLISADHFRDKHHRLAEFRQGSLPQAPGQGRQQRLPAGHPQNVVHRFPQNHPPGVVALQEKGLHVGQPFRTRQGGGRHPGHHQLTGPQVVELEHLADHGRLVGFNAALLVTQAGQQTDLRLIGDVGALGRQGRNQALKDEHQWQQQPGQLQEHGGNHQGHLHVEAGPQRLGQDFPHHDYQQSEQGGKDRHPLVRQGQLLHNHPAGKASQHDAAKGVEHVVGDHYSRQRPPQLKPQAFQAVGPRYATAAEVLHLEGGGGHNGCFTAGAEGRPQQERHRQQEKSAQGVHRRHLGLLIPLLFSPRMNRVWSHTILGAHSCI